MAVEERRSRDTSPTNKVKFFCSYGGMILPRPFDGQLKYAGGETRVISAHPTILFSDLMSKINKMFEGEFVLKYQIGPEELDALVSVKSDEDLGHMLDEYERLERGGASKLRAFLFPSKPSVIESHSPTWTQTQTLEQRYVDALNGVVRCSSHFRRPIISSSRLKSSCSNSPSQCTSPCSPSPRMSVSGGGDTTSFISSLHGKLNSMTRVQSSPSLASNNHDLVYPAGYHQYHHQQQQQQPQPWMQDDYGTRLPLITNHPPNVALSSAQCHPTFHNRSAHLAQYAGAYFT